MAFPNSWRPAVHGLAVEGFRTLEAVSIRCPGALTVVCGPNNAGKSSLLECFGAYEIAVNNSGPREIRPLRKDHDGGDRVSVAAFVPFRQIGTEDQTMSLVSIGEIAAPRVGEVVEEYAGLRDEGGLWVWFSVRLVGASLELKADTMRLDVARSAAQLEALRSVSVTKVADREVQRSLVGQRNDGRRVIGRADFWSELIRTSLPKVSVESIPDVRRAADRPLGSEDLQRLVRASVDHFDGRREPWTEAIDGVLQDVFGPDVTYRAQPGSPDQFWVQIDGERRQLEETGAGVREVVAIAYKALVQPSRTLITIEEPENCLHPTAVRRLVQSLPRRCGCQLVVATHSAAVVDSGPESVVRVHRQGDVTEVTSVDNARERYQAVWDLGNRPSELVLTPCAVWVEGPSDRVYLSEWLKARGLSEGVEFEIVFFGGSLGAHVSMGDSATALVRLRALSRRCVLVADSDRSSEAGALKPAVVRLQADVLDDPNAEVFVTPGREIENLLPIDVINTVRASFGGDPMLPQNRRWSRVLGADSFAGRRPPEKVPFALAAIDALGGRLPDDAEEMLDSLEEFIRNSLA